MEVAPIAFAVAWIVAGLAQLVLVLAAFDTSAKLGVMTLFVPMYAASLGNHRLRTRYRKVLAIIWWAAFAAMVAAVMASG